MKIIYTSHLFEPHKIVIDDELEKRIQDARDEVFRLATGQNWRPSIEIDLPQNPVDPNDEIHHRDFIVKVTWDDGTEDNVHQRILKFLGGKEARGWVRVDLGHYCYEGWDSAIDNRDLSELPEVWFENMFVNGFLKPRKQDGKVWNVLEEDHQKQLIPILYREARRKIRYDAKSEYFSKDIPYLESLAACCKDSWEGKKSLADLIQLCESRILQESEGNSSKERE